MPTDRGLTLPVFNSTGWDDEVNANFSRMADMAYNVKGVGYAAVGDGTTDDTAAIQAAINAASTAGGGIVYFPKATYAVSTLQLKSNVYLLGAGKNAAILKATSAGTYLLRSNNGSGVQYVTIRGLGINANGQAQRAVSLTSPSGLPGHNLITDCNITSSTARLVELGGASGYECHCIRNDMSCTDLGAGAGIVCTGTDNIVAMNNMGSITTYGIDLQAGGQQVIGNHVVTKGANAVGLRMTGGQTTLVEGNYFDTSGATDQPMILIQPDASALLANPIINGNQFYMSATPGGLSNNGVTPVIYIDQTTGGGTVQTVQITNNSGRAKSANRWSAIVGTSGTVSNWTLRDNLFEFCNSVGGYPSWLGVNQFYDGTAWRIGRRRQPRTALTYSSSIAVNAEHGAVLTITATDTTAFTIQDPTNAFDGMELTFAITSAAGGSHGTITWGTSGTKFRLAGGAWTAPAASKERSINFVYSNTDSKWHEQWRTSGDV